MPGAEKRTGESASIVQNVVQLVLGLSSSLRFLFTTLVVAPWTLPCFT